VRPLLQNFADTAWVHVELRGNSMLKPALLAELPDINGVRER
jgi:hypothetical protein